MPLFSTGKAQRQAGSPSAPFHPPTDHADTPDRPVPQPPPEAGQHNEAARPFERWVRTSLFFPLLVIGMEECLFVLFCLING